MGWNDFYRRRDLADEVLRRARRDPHGPVPYAEVPGAVEAFGSEENLLLALQYTWTQLLSGHLRTELSGKQEPDHVEAVSLAWRTAVARHPTLHRLLEANAEDHERLRSMRDAELRMLAISAGLAEPQEHADEVTRIGAAFVALLEEGDLPRARRRNPVGQLLRLLAPSA